MKENTGLVYDLSSTYWRIPYPKDTGKSERARDNPRKEEDRPLRVKCDGFVVNKETTGGGEWEVTQGGWSKTGVEISRKRPIKSSQGGSRCS